MNEKFPVPQAEHLVGKEELSSEGLDRLSQLVSVAPDESGKVDIHAALEDVFRRSGSRVIEGLEIEKNENDKEIIALATESVKAFARELGREDFIDLPINNIHYLKDGGVEKFTKGRLKIGSHSTMLGEVMIDRRNDLETSITTFHELWHSLASYNTLQVTTKGTIESYRSGFGMKSRDGSKEYFYRVDEGLTGLMTKRFVEEILANHPKFKELIEEKRAKGEEIDTTRRGEVKLIHYIANAVYERNKDSIETHEAVITMLLQGQVTGNILPIGKLIEKTFDKGSFRLAGEKTQP